MQGISQAITIFNRWLGFGAAWLCLCLVLLQVIIVLNRYCFGYSSIFGHAMINYEEALLYIFSAIFLLGAAYTYCEEGHVRLDILFGSFEKSTQRMIDLIGNVVLLLPFMVLLIVKSNHNLVLSWDIAEKSPDGGLPYIYVWIAMVPLFAISLALQAVANVIRLTPEVFPSTRFAHIGVAAFVIAIFGTVFFYSIGWAESADWKQVNPQWRFWAYSFGVWFTRIASAGICILVAVDLVGKFRLANTNSIKEGAS